MRETVANRTLRASATRGAGALRNGARPRFSVLGIVCALAATATGAPAAEQTDSVDSSMSSAATRQDVAPPSLGDSKSAFMADIAARKSYWIPAGEIEVSTFC